MFDEVIATSLRDFVELFGKATARKTFTDVFHVYKYIPMDYTDGLELDFPIIARTNFKQECKNCLINIYIYNDGKIIK